MDSLVSSLSTGIFRPRVYVSQLPLGRARLNQPPEAPENNAAVSEHVAGWPGFEAHLRSDLECVRASCVQELRRTGKRDWSM